MRRLTLALIASALLATAPAVQADVVLDWNEVLLDAIRLDKTPPPKASRAMAMTHVAIFDAVNGIVGGYAPYLVHDHAPEGASAEAAAAAAAHDVLAALYPAQEATFDAALTTSLAGVPNGQSETDGVHWGETVAAAILAARANDGATTVTDYTYPSGASWWQPTPPAFASALLPNWPHVTPWALASGSQLRPAAPPPPNSAAHLAAFDEVRAFGKVDSAVRTADQAQIALFWADGAGTATPPGHWNVIAQGLSAEHHLSLADNARLFALLNIAEADAGIVAWDAKYAYSCWRPVTAIQHADDDGNPDTHADAGWLPLLATPPFPGYTSGHSTFSSAGARLLALFFGTDHVAFSTTSDGLPGVTRQFTSLSQAAAEAGQSRIYGGIHWQYDNQVGLQTGRAIGELVFFGQLAPLAAPGACHPSATTLCLNDGRFAVTAAWSTHDHDGPALAVDGTTDSGSFYFFDEANTELTVKVLDACQQFDRYWVFASGLTNVEVTLTVTDTHTGITRRYFNPQGKPFAPVQDTDAFATCP